jgi:hypothetical protein
MKRLRRQESDDTLRSVKRLVPGFHALILGVHPYLLDHMASMLDEQPAAVIPVVSDDILTRAVWNCKMAPI